MLLHLGGNGAFHGFYRYPVVNFPQVPLSLSSLLPFPCLPTASAGRAGGCGGVLDTAAGVYGNTTLTIDRPKPPSRNLAG